MLLTEFKQSFVNSNPPLNLSVPVQALWYDGKGNWDKAHRLIDSLTDTTACWVHAYLHRKQGDLGNAAYWYHRAKKQMPEVSLQQEWEQIVNALI